MNKYKIGDKVKVTKSDSSVYNLTGTVKKVYDNGMVGIEFLEWNEGHDCDNTVENNHGWNVDFDDLKHDDWKGRMGE